MKALVFDESLSLQDVPQPNAAGECLVRVTMAGICKTDVEIIKGYMNYKGILGHEFVGVIEKAPSRNLIGHRVVGEINCGCGDCEFCRRGLARHCVNRTVIGIQGHAGCFAEYINVPCENLVRVQQDIPDEKAVFTEPVAAALEILEQVKIEPSSRVLVIGDGKLGLLITMVLRLVGCDLTICGKHEAKTNLIRSNDVSIIHPKDLSQSSNYYDYVVEASGSPSGWSAAVQVVKPRGTIVLKSTYAGDMNFNPALLVIKEVTLVGSRCGRFEPALRMLAAGLVDPSPLITQMYPFENAQAAFERATQSDALKILMKFSSQQ